MLLIRNNQIAFEVFGITSFSSLSGFFLISFSH